MVIYLSAMTGMSQIAQSSAMQNIDHSTGIRRQAQTVGCETGSLRHPSLAFQPHPAALASAGHLC